MRITWTLPWQACLFLTSETTRRLVRVRNYGTVLVDRWRLRRWIIAFFSNQLYRKYSFRWNLFYKSYATPEKMSKNALIRRCDVHPSAQTIPQSLTRTSLLTDFGVENYSGRSFGCSGQPSTSKYGFLLFFLLPNCLLQFFYCVFYSILTSLDIFTIVALFSILFTIEIHRTLFSLPN